MKNSNFWITWNNSTRSKELSKEFDLQLLNFDTGTPPFRRHFSASFATIFSLIRYRPKKIICQYSFLLLVILKIYKTIFRNTKILADCHNKALKRSINLPIVNSIFWVTKKWSFRGIEGIIITNQGLYGFAEKLNTNVYILGDPIPDFSPPLHQPSNNGSRKVVFISSFAKDEPHDLVINAANRLISINFFITGSPPRSFLKEDISGNITLTGFLDEQEYIKLLLEADTILSLSTEKEILQCSTYEAISLEKPTIVADSDTARNTFGECVIYSHLSIEDLIKSIEYSFKHATSLQAKTRAFKTEYRHKFNSMARPIISIIMS